MRLIEQVDEQYFFRPAQAVVDPRMRALCKHQYYKHPDGCLNWGVRADCPPHVPIFSRVYKSEVYVVAVSFHLEQYAELKSIDHPDWNRRQLTNLRHWQEHVRMHLREYVAEVTPENFEPVYNPEAMAVNLTETCRMIGIDLEWPPIQWVYKIALLAQTLEDNRPEDIAGYGQLTP